MRAACSGAPQKEIDSDGVSDKEHRGAFPEPVMTATMKTAAVLNGGEEDKMNAFTFFPAAAKPPQSRGLEFKSQMCFLAAWVLPVL